MTAADETGPQTAAGKQAAEDKAAAAERIRAISEADQRAAAEAEADRKKAQTAAARQARAQRRAAEQNGATVDEAPPADQPCEGCRDYQEMVLARMGRLETQVQAIGKLVLTGVIAGLVVWVMSGREKAAALEGPAE